MEESNSPLYPLRLFGLVIEFGLSIILYFYFVFILYALRTGNANAISHSLSDPYSLSLRVTQLGYNQIEEI